MAIQNNKKWRFFLVKHADRKREDGSFPIAIELKFTGRKVWTQEQLTTLPQYWNKDIERVEVKPKKNPQGVLVNVELDYFATKINDIVKEYRDKNLLLTNEIVVSKLELKVKGETVEGYSIEHIRKLKENAKIGSAIIFAEMLTYFQKYDKNFSKRMFAEINYDYIMSFVTTQLDVAREGGPRKKGGISVNVRSMRTILNSAITDGVGCPETYPFSNIYGVKSKIFCITKELKSKPRKRSVPKNYLKQLYDHEFSNKALQRSKAYFFFSFFCGGVNFIDMSKLKITDIKKGFDTKDNPMEYFTFYRNKTNEPIEVVINKDIRKQIDFLRSNFETIEDYLFPIITVPGLDADARYKHVREKRKKLNKYLKRMVEMLGFPDALHEITVYFARYSFAMNMYNKTENIDVVGQCMHHSDTKTTKMYLEDIEKDRIAELTSNLLDLN